MEFLVIAHDVKQYERCKVYNPITIVLRLNACDRLLIHQSRSVSSEFLAILSISLRGDGLHRWFIRCHWRSSSGPQLRHKRTWPSTETGLGAVGGVPASRDDAMNRCCAIDSKAASLARALSAKKVNLIKARRRGNKLLVEDPSRAGAVRGAAALFPQPSRFLK
jgi:hypothetical protein